jgi:hypothetical protein
MLPGAISHQEALTLAHLIEFCPNKDSLVAEDAAKDSSQIISSRKEEDAVRRIDWATRGI